MIDEENNDEHESGGGDGGQSSSEQTRNPQARIKSLLEANQRLSKKLAQREARIKELEQASTTEQQAEFLKHVYSNGIKLVDLDTALYLAHKEGVFEEENLSEAIDAMLDTYSFLVEDEDNGQSAPKQKQGGRTLSKPKDKGVDQAALARRFPALRQRPHGPPVQTPPR